MVVLDASALLAYLRQETGHEAVRQALEAGAICSAANWSETMQKILQRGDDWVAMRQLLMSYQLSIEPVTMSDAEQAAAIWLTNQSLSLGDRLCLSLAHRLGAVALTADAAWGESPMITQLR